MIVAVDGLAALPALLRAFVLGQVIVHPGKRGKSPVAHRAVNTAGFVIVAEHGGKGFKPGRLPTVSGAAER